MTTDRSEAAQLRDRIAAVRALEQPDPPLLNGTPGADSAWAAGWWTCFHTALGELTDPAEIQATLAASRQAQARVRYDPERRRQARTRFKEMLRGTLERLEADEEYQP
jgi:hypothetical protein